MISTTVHTTENLTELHRLQERAKKLGKRCVTVGWHSDKGREGHWRYIRQGLISQDFRTPLIQVAIAHEFGSPSRRIPARPILRTALRNRGFVRRLVTKTAEEYWGFLHGRHEDVALGNIGRFWKARVMDVFGGENSWQSLKPNTLAKRAAHGNLSTNPLIDTDHLRQGVESRVQPDYRE